MTTPTNESSMIHGAKKEIVYRNFNPDKTNHAAQLRIVHFNDVYNIEGLKEEPVGGAARFKTVLDEVVKDKHAIVLFSGDAVSPSQRKR